MNDRLQLLYCFYNDKCVRNGTGNGVEITSQLLGLLLRGSR